MKLPRRKFLHLAAGVAAVPAISRIAGAQTYPTRPIRLVVPFPPGGAFDTIGRPWADRMKSLLGTVVVENIGGGGGSVGAAQASRARPDGYTLLLGGATTHITEALLKNRPQFDPLNDLEPISGIAITAFALAVHPSVPVNNLNELIDYAKANPGKLAYGSAGTGSLNHLTAEAFKLRVGVADIIHVPYRGVAPALTDLIGGQAQVMFPSVLSSLEYIRAGKLRVLAVTTATRSQALPNVPNVGEFVPGYEASFVYGLGAPKNTPTEIVEKLNQETNTGLADPKIKARFGDLGGTVLPGSPADFGKLIADETEKWAKVIRAAGIKAE
jgi:tripartite-type tricarboxylate transporter receptor subunit TctC